MESQIALEYVKVKDGFNLSGKNFTGSITSERSGDPDLIYDRETKEVRIFNNGKMAIVPISNVISMTPKSNVKSIPVQESQAPVHGKKIKAQVSSPTMHVFEGSGVEPK